jgi:glutamyl-tRNA reductase
MSDPEDAVLAALRSRFEAVSAAELKRMEKRLRRLSEDDRAFIVSLTRDLVARLLDSFASPLPPDQAKARAELLRELFDLPGA